MDNLNSGIIKDEVTPPLTDDEKMWAGLCYPVWFGYSPWILLTDKKNEPYLFYHALHGLYYGIASTVITILVSVLFFLIFLYKNVRDIAGQAPPPEAGIKVISAATIITIIAFTVYCLFIIFSMCYSFWLGWKAAEGRIFKLPLIGEIAWEKMTKQRPELEKKYSELLLGSLKKPPKEIPVTFEEAMGLPPVPGNNIEIKKEEPVIVEADKKSEPITSSIEKFIKEKIPVDKIRSIFLNNKEEDAPAAGPVIAAPDGTGIKPVIEEKPVISGHKQLTPLEQLALLRKKMAQETIPSAKELPAKPPSAPEPVFEKADFIPSVKNAAEVEKPKEPEEIELFEPVLTEELPEAETPSVSWAAVKTPQKTTLPFTSRSEPVSDIELLSKNASAFKMERSAFKTVEGGLYRKPVFEKRKEELEEPKESLPAETIAEAVKEEIIEEVIVEKITPPEIKIEKPVFEPAESSGKRSVLEELKKKREKLEPDNFGHPSHPKTLSHERRRLAEELIKQMEEEKKNLTRIKMPDEE